MAKKIRQIVTLLGQSGNIKIDPFLLVLNEKGEFMNSLFIIALNENFPHWSVKVWI